MEGCSFTGDLRVKRRLFIFIRRPFHLVSEKYVKEGSGTGVSLHRGPAGGTWRRDSFTGDFERQVKEGSGNGACLCMGL
jgi:hypothetical protein